MWDVLGRLATQGNAQLMLLLAAMVCISTFVSVTIYRRTRTGGAPIVMRKLSESTVSGEVTSGTSSGEEEETLSPPPEPPEQTRDAALPPPALISHDSDFSTARALGTETESSTAFSPAVAQWSIQAEPSSSARDRLNDLLIGSSPFDSYATWLLSQSTASTISSRTSGSTTSRTQPLPITGFQLQPQPITDFHHLQPQPMPDLHDSPSISYWVSHDYPRKS
ncbi:unnamed protein product [Cyprideis torosa]|uniref:Uncharacterized protein n=1 Tax=Cyprideis torosa TaxID=163714 RepID=A0A7R8ZSL4_9CRUS|nr:unnamed protein product [Cyprideis torosa]CAG0901972.1 unnamed protein product [Cyprideis torosa]